MTLNVDRHASDELRLESGRGPFGILSFLKRYGTLTALIALILFNFAFTPHFATMQTLDVNLTQVCTIVIVGVGMTLVIATGGIDLSVGSLMAIAGALAPGFFTGKLFHGGDLYVDIALSIVIPIIVAGLFGLFNGWLVSSFNIQPIVATLILFIAGRGIAQVWTNGDLQVFKAPQFQAIAIGRVFGIPFQVYIMAVIVVIAAWVLQKTVFGRQVLAVGGNEAAARLAGVPVRRVKRLVYVVSGLCAGVAGLIVIAENSAADAKSHRDGHGTRRHRGRRGRRNVAVGRPRVHPRHAARRSHHPTRSLYSSGEWRA